MYLVFAFVELLVIAVAIPRMIEEGSNKQQKLNFRPEKAITIVVMLCMMAFSIIFMAFDLTRQHDRIGQIIVGFMYALEFCLYLYLLNSRMYVTETHLVCRTMFRRTKTYPLAEIQKIESYYSGLDKDPHAYRLFLSKKQIRIENFWTNFQEFLPCVKKQIKKMGHRCEYSSKINGVDIQKASQYKGKAVILRQHPVTAVGSFVSTILFTVVLVFCIKTQQGVPETSAVGLFCLLIFIWLCWHVVWKLELPSDESYLIYRPFIWKTQKIYYHQITGYKEANNLLVIQTTSGKIRVPVGSRNLAYLLLAFQKYNIHEEKEQYKHK